MKFQIASCIKILTFWSFAIVLGITCFQRSSAQAQTLSSFAFMRHSFELRTSTRYHFDEMPITGWTYHDGATVDPRLNFSYQLRINKASLMSAELDIFYNLKPIPGKAHFYSERFDCLLNITYQYEFIQLTRAVYGVGTGISFRSGQQAIGKYYFGSLNNQHFSWYTAIGINLGAFFKYPLWRRWHLTAATDFSPYLKILNDGLGNPFHLPENQYLWRIHTGLGYKVGRISKQHVLPKHR